ncbi:phosphoribosylanthranilate isomerase [Fredinandcohnia humi]
MQQLLIKYCGNQSKEDIEIVTDSNASYIGFIFANSKRFVNPLLVKEWLKKVSFENKKLVGVFVNADISYIDSVLSQVPLSVIQCHGTETPQYVIQLKKTTKIQVWKVIHHEEGSLENMKGFQGIADGYVIDTKVKNLWGGSGTSFDWKYIPHYIEEAKRQGVPCLIAGGIHVGNIEQLLKYEIDGIDISSGIERNGKKDKQVIETIEKWVNKNVERT